MAGILFVVLQVAGWGLSVSAYPSDTYDYQDFFAETGNRWRASAGSWLMLLAAVVLLWFLVSLHRRILEAGAPARMAANASLMSGAVYVVLHLVGTMAASVAPLGAFQSTSLELDSVVIDLLEFLGIGMLFVPGLLAAGLCVATTSAGAAKAVMLPKWLVVAGYVVSAVCLFGVLALPYAVWLLWVLVVSLALLVRDRAHSRVTPPPPSEWWTSAHEPSPSPSGPPYLP